MSTPMNRLSTWFGISLALVSSASVAFAQCKVSTSTRQFEGAKREIVTMENERILVEVVPELEGRVTTFRDKTRAATPFEWLDDCPYHYGARWEGKPFTYRIDEKGPDQASVTVTGGGKIAVALMRAVTGLAVANPVDLKVERFMSINARSTRLRVGVKFTNVGEGVAPKFRNMVHTVIGQVPPMPGVGRACWFLPTASGVEFFDPQRGGQEMWASASGAPLDHPFSRFTPGVKADKPRYEAGGWGAVNTSAGPVYIFYDPPQYDFIQYWFGGDSAWHFTFEPQTKAVDLKPGESQTGIFTLAFDSQDVPFNTPTVAYERSQAPEWITPGGTLKLSARATTVRNTPEHAEMNFEVKEAKGQAVFSKKVEGDVQSFAFTSLDAEVKLADNAPLGFYTWRTTRSDGKEIASGRFEVVSAEEVTKRQMEKATREMKEQIDSLRKDNSAKALDIRALNTLWRDEANLALSLGDPAVWPTEFPAGAVLTRTRGTTPVLGNWQAEEMPRLKALSPAPLPVWPADPEKWLAVLKDDRALVRDVAPEPGGKSLAVLLIDPAKKRVEVVRVNEGGIVKRFGRFAEKPGESDDALGVVARGVAVDPEGNIWVTTNAWGQTTVFKRNQDNAPYEESIIGDKGALKKFAPDGRLLGALSLLDAPTDLALGAADGVAITLVPFRSVSEYHGAQVREGVMLVRTADVKRIGELKIPAGTISIDEAGRVWAADVAGHVACYSIRGTKQFDVAASPAPAVPDARLPASSPAPVVVRADGKGTVWALFTLGRKLVALDVSGAAKGEAKGISDDAGAIYRCAITPSGPMAISDKKLWLP